MKLLLITIVSIAFSFTKAEFYSVISSDNESVISTYLKKIEGTESQNIKAYKGALLMKKASFQKAPKDKLSFFKEGRSLLEIEISGDPKNTEYRFIRLIIQENAPKFLKYNTNITEDAEWVKKNYISLKSDVKKEVISYSKSSVNLNL